VGGLDARPKTFLCKQINVAKTKEKPDGYLVGYSKEGYGSKRALLSMMMMPNMFKQKSDTQKYTTMVLDATTALSLVNVTLALNPQFLFHV
jgi:hypothetical protein